MDELFKQKFDKGEKTLFNEIKTSEDIKNFLDKTNQLHDGYIIGVQYTDNGITRAENVIHFNPEKTKLTLQILVTSIFDTVVEIEFENVWEWQMKSEAGEVFAACINCIGQDCIVWSSEIYANTDELKRNSYVIAKSMKWRIVE